MERQDVEQRSGIKPHMEVWCREPTLHLHTTSQTQFDLVKCYSLSQKIIDPDKIIN